MCGLVGVFNPKESICGNDDLIKMRDTMVHRGPDGSGIWFSKDRKCGFAHRRLSIIDLSDFASQPMINNNKDVVLVFNGEIYNHKELRQELNSLGKYIWRTDHSDTEVFLNAYQEWGLKCLDRFYGMFAFAIYDFRNKSKPILHLGRDRMGVKPLYFSKTKKGEWVFGSEIRALLKHPEISAEMDLNAFWHYLTFIVSPAPLTMFKGIFKIPCGYYISIDHNGNANAYQWWDNVPKKKDVFKKTDLSFDEAVLNLTDLIKDSIQRRMVSDVHFGVLLSGGVDSSLTTALMSEMLDRPVRTFTVGYEQYKDFNEFNTADYISKKYKTDHHEVKINSKEALDFLPLLINLQDEPIADNVCIPLYFLAKLVKDNDTTVVQVGEGADEHFLGYWWCEHYRKKYNEIYQPAYNSQLSFFKKIFSRAKKSLPVVGSDEDLEFIRRAKNSEELFWGGAVCFTGKMRNELTPDIRVFSQELNCPVNGLSAKHFENCNSHEIIKYLCKDLRELEEPTVLQKISYIESKLRLPEHLLMRVDKMTMANSIEARVPFLDHEVVDFARRLPLDYKLKDGIGKRILKKVAEPYIDDQKLLYQRKRGFGAPMDQWFGEEHFSKKCLSAFENSYIYKEKFLNNDMIKNLLKNQLKGARGYGFHLWTVMNVVLWHNIWVEGNNESML